MTEKVDITRFNRSLTGDADFDVLDKSLDDIVSTVNHNSEDLLALANRTTYTILRAFEHAGTHVLLSKHGRGDMVDAWVQIGDNSGLKDQIKIVTDRAKPHDMVYTNRWNVSAAVYMQKFSIAGQETSPTGVFFKPDGAKMYMIGFTGDDVNEYGLSTPWNVTTAVYLQKFSVAGQETSPTGVFFKPDGAKMYVVGSDGDDVNEYDLSTPWDVSTAVYLQVFSIAGQETAPQGIFFKPDGAKMYIIGFTGDDVNEYGLSTPWNVTTAVYMQKFSIVGQDTLPKGLFFKPDGAKMYVVGDSGNDINEYDLSTPWDISTAVYLQVFSVAGQETSPTGVFFKPDGAKMYVLGDSGNDVNEYDLKDSVITPIEPRIEGKVTDMIEIKSSEKSGKIKIFKIIKKTVGFNDMIRINKTTNRRILVGVTIENKNLKMGE